MAHFDIPKENRTGSLTEFGNMIETMKSYQKAFDALENIEPLIDELYDHINLFNDCDSLYNAISDLYINTYCGRESLIRKAKYLRKEIDKDNSN